MKQCVLSFLMIVILGCSSQKTDQIPDQFQELENLTVYSTDTTPVKTISFKKDVIYGNTNKVLLGSLTEIAVDGSGRVFIADIENMTIHVFEPGGRFIDQLGRDGRGPGEFSSIHSIQIQGDRLYAFDLWPYNKAHIFTLDSLTREETIIFARNRGDYQELYNAFPIIHEIYVRNNNTYLAVFILNSSKQHKLWKNIDIRGLFYLLDSTGKIVSNNLIDIKADTRTSFQAFDVPVKPFFGNALTVLSSDNSIYLVGPGHVLIKEYSPNGVYQSSFYYPHNKISITRESAVEAEVPDIFINSMDSMDLPKTWPVLTDMKIDNQDRLWIATTVKDMNVYEWWVLENTGELIVKFKWPRNEPIEVVKNEYVYTRETNVETGHQQIVRYRFEMN